MNHRGTTATMKSSLFSSNNNNRRGNNNNNNNNNNSPNAAAAASAATSQQEVDDVIRENDAMLNALQSATSRMNDGAGRLRNEATEHNQIVDQLLRGIGSASHSVRGTITKIDNVMAKHGCSGTVILSVGVFLAFVAFYYILKYAWNASRAPAVPLPPVSGAGGSGGGI